MDKVCVYKHCNRSVKTDKNIQLFPFPKDEKWCKFWLKYGCSPILNNIDVKELHANYRLCNAHFNPEDFLSETELKPMAYPKSMNEIRGVQLNNSGRVSPPRVVIKLDNIKKKVVAPPKPPVDLEELKNVVENLENAYIPTDSSIATKSKIYVGNNNMIYVVAPEVSSNDPLTTENSSSLKLLKKPLKRGDIELYKKLTSNEILHYIFNSTNNEQFCRICLLKTDDYIELFPDDLAKQNEIIEFKKILNDLFDINYELYDKPVICKKCYEHVIISFELKQKVLINEPELRRILMNYRPKSKKNDDISSKSESNNIDDELIKETKKYLKPQDSKFVRSLKNDLNLFDPKHDNYFKVERKFPPKLVKAVRTIYSERNYQEPKPWLCDICGKLYNNESHRYSHCSKKSKAYICENCGLTLPNSSAFLYHKNTKHQSYNCKHCEEVLPNHSAFTAHMRQKHRDKILPCKCPKCGKLLISKNSLFYHMRTHHSILKCKLCPKRFRNKFGLIKHLKNDHQKEPMNSCTFCERRFWSSEKLKDHIKNIHNEEIKIKEEIPVINEDIGENLDTDTEEPPVLPEDGGEILPTELFECEVCHKKFYHKMYLRKHKKIHSEGNTIYTCPICAIDRTGRRRNMKSRSSLDRHMRIFHSDDSQNKCIVCQKAFWKLGVLRDHLKRKHNIHVNNRREMCEIDEEHVKKLREAYKQTEKSRIRKIKPQPKQHSQDNIKDENEQFACQLCKESGRKRGKIISEKSLERHMKIFHSEEPLNKCEICGQSFWNLRKHMKSKHSNITQDKELPQIEEEMNDKLNIELEVYEDNGMEVIEYENIYIKDEDIEIVDDDNLQNIREIINDDHLYF